MSDQEERTLLPIEELLPAVPKILDDLVVNSNKTVDNLVKLWDAVTKIATETAEIVKIQQNQIQLLQSQILTLNERLEAFLTPQVN